MKTKKQLIDFEHKGNEKHHFKLRPALLSLCMLTFIGGYSQTGQVNLNLKNASVKELFREIEKQTSYRFSYRDAEVNNKGGITISGQGKELKEVLTNELAKQQLSYTVSGNKIIVSPAKKEAISTREKKVTGKVVDTNGEPVIGATIMEKGTTNGTITDFDGNFTLDVSTNSQLEISYVGYQTQTIKASFGKELSIKLREDTELLDEVVVVGYGVQKKVNLTGSVASIDFSKEIDKRPVMNVTHALAGKMPGLSVMQTTGEPGKDNATLRIRGNGSLNSNSPLILVDGIECSLDNVNPNDIASISVLKDAGSAAIYGSRAANGVILVTTKKGSEGKTTVNYTFSGTFQNPYINLEPVSNTARYMTLVNEGCENIGVPNRFSAANIELWEEASKNPNALHESGYPNYMIYPNTDWFDVLFNRGFAQEHNLSLSGGTEKMNYLLSVGFLDNEGVMNAFGTDTGIRKYNFRLNLEANPFKWLKVGTRFFGQQYEKGLSRVADGFTYFFATSPGLYPGEPDKWGILTNSGEDFSNHPGVSVYKHLGDDITYKLNATLYGTINPLPGLYVDGKFNYSPNFYNYKSYQRDIRYYNYALDKPDRVANNSTLPITMKRNLDYQVNSELIARYNTDFKGSKHDLGVIMGYTTTYFKSDYLTAEKQGGTEWSLNDDISTYSTLKNTTGSINEWALRSYFGRVNYSYKEKYLFEGNMRIDGSSRFSPENRYGYFPSFSGAWRISEEDFMKRFENLSNLKLRASWGSTGNNASGNYDWQTLYDVSKVVLNNAMLNAFVQSKLSNNSLQWETTTTTNIGLDFGLFNNKLSGSLDVYNKYTDGILYTPSIYLTMGFITGSTQNLAAVRNRGVELNLTYSDNIGKDFNYTVSANLAYNKNKVMKFKGELNEYWTYDENGNKDKWISNRGEVQQSGFGGVICEGHPIGETMLQSTYKGTGAGYNGGELDLNAGPKDGMIRTEADMNWVKAMIDAGYLFNGTNQVGKNKLWYGDLIYEDWNGDGNYGDSNDSHFSGHTNMPLFNFGLNIGLNWKNFDMSMVWSGAFKFHLLWNNGWNRATFVQGQQIMSHVADNHYFYNPDVPDDPRTNINATYPRATYNLALSNYLNSDYYEYRGDYMKLKNVQIGYSLPNSIISKIKLSRLRAFVSMDNILTITGYPGMDPEIGVTMGYPLMRQISFGAQVAF